MRAKVFLRHKLHHLGKQRLARVHSVLRAAEMNPKQFKSRTPKKTPQLPMNERITREPNQMNRTLVDESMERREPTEE
jgi:hypothetical protein